MAISDFGILIRDNPALAHNRLVKLFHAHETVVGVAKALKAAERSLALWLEMLRKAGYPDPRTGEFVDPKKSTPLGGVNLAARIARDGRKVHSELVEHFRQHKTRQGVAAALGVAQHTVSRWIAQLERQGLTDPREVLARQGVRVRHDGKRLTADQKRQIVSRYCAGGVTVAQLAESFGINPSTVSRVLGRS